MSPSPRGAVNRALRWAAAAAIIAAAAGCTSGNHASPSTHRPTTEPQVSAPSTEAPSGSSAPVSNATAALLPDSGTMIGAWVQSGAGRYNIAAHERVVTQLEQLLGHKLAIDAYYYKWDQSFPTASQRWDVAEGRVPLISWNTTTLTDVSSGRADSIIVARAKALRAFGHPVLLRWAWEMDAKAHHYDPAQYIAAWRHIHDVFAQQGVTNVSWVWCPMHSAFTNGKASQYYPGDNYVDWVCADGYAAFRGRPYTSFASLFQPMYQFGVAHHKPMMIGEFGVEERGPGQKAQWIEQAAEDLATRFPQIRAAIYFDSTRDADWRLQSSPQAVAAFRSLVSAPHLNAAAPTP